MIKKLIKHGNSTAVILDKSILKLLNIDPDTNVKIKTDGESIIITPLYDDKVKKVSKKKISKNKLVQQAFEETMTKYAPALEKLSKN